MERAALERNPIPLGRVLNGAIIGLASNKWGAPIHHRFERVRNGWNAIRRQEKTRLRTGCVIEDGHIVSNA